MHKKIATKTKIKVVSQISWIVAFVISGLLAYHTMVVSTQPVLLLLALINLAAMSLSNPEWVAKELEIVHDLSDEK
jgi:hypothetical protein